MILYGFWFILGRVLGLEMDKKWTPFPKNLWDQIFYGFVIDFERFFGRFWKWKSTTRSIEILMNFSITFHIDFRTICDRLLSRNCIPFRRAVMPKVTYVLRERVVEKHCKNRMKMQTSMLRMDHLASTRLVTNHRIWVCKRALLGKQVSNSFGGKIYSKSWSKIHTKITPKRYRK